MRNYKYFLIIFFVLLIGCVSFLVVGYRLQNQLMETYQKQDSVLVQDRNGEIIFRQPNERGYWASYLDKVPVRFKKLLLKKEDKYFPYHLGLNPLSTLQAGLGYSGIGKRRASSTITQQLVKILLQKELKRTLKNKIIEAFYALSLETFKSKEAILKMYVNSVYFGNQAQGLAEASQLYFNLSPDLLTDGQILQLLSTINNPSSNNPLKPKNREIASALAQRLCPNSQNLIMTSAAEIKENAEKHSRFSTSYFELRNLINNSSPSQQVTLDKELTEKIRKIVARNTEDLKPKNAKQGAVVVIKLPENELLALVGSPDPQSSEEGYKINILEAPRPIGSTIKPFIYLKAFEKGLRPYTAVEDKEYKYITAIGFPLYPKNFDYKYRGTVSLHYALSNSLNVPAVKVLEYVGLQNFYEFLEKDLGFNPVQNLGNYQLGIALGGLEMSLLDLAKYFTIFPNNGILKGLKIYPEEPLSEKEIAKPRYIQLINKLLNDRQTGIEQFGLKSELNLFQENYGLKTGTSRDFRDSWVVGYTPDFLVGVWMGNSDNSPMDEVSGQVGAGRIWAQVMEMLLNSAYNKKTPFNFELLKEFYNKGNVEYGLLDDDYEKCLNALQEQDLSLILSPHQGDVFLLEPNTKIILKAKENVKWFSNKEFLGEGKNTIFIPSQPGQYQIKAIAPDDFEETVTIWLQ